MAPKILGGVTANPLDTYKCFTTATDMSICDSERKWIIIDTDLCITLNKDGMPIDTNSIPDYRLQCVGFWKENLISYLVTFDPSDPVSAYRCWVYLRIGETEIRLSQAVGSACGLHQTFHSHSFEEGAAVALNLSLHDRFNDLCPMYYDDGRDPWASTQPEFKVFRFTNKGRCLKAEKFFFLLNKILLLLNYLRH